jgi:hypothetical protein
MTELMNAHCKDEIAIPLDIDEFIVLYDKNTNTICAKKKEILKYFRQLPIYPLYKMNYINSICNESENIKDSTHGEYQDLGNVSKVFLHTSLFHHTLDHGNHYMCDDYIRTNICLIHFHLRNLTQIKKKVRNNILGLGYSDDIESLKKIIAKDPCTPGSHHIYTQIELHENIYVINKFSAQEHFITLQPFTEELKKLQLDFYFL